MFCSLIHTQCFSHNIFRYLWRVPSSKKICFLRFYSKLHSNLFVQQQQSLLDKCYRTVQEIFFLYHHICFLVHSDSEHEFISLIHTFKNEQLFHLKVIIASSSSFRCWSSLPTVLGMRTYLHYCVCLFFSIFLVLSISFNCFPSFSNML